MQKKLEKRLIKIKEKISQEGFSFEGLFVSKEGIILATHLEDTMEFCVKGFTVSLISLFIPILGKIEKWRKTEEAQELMKDNIETEKQAEMIEAFNAYQEYDPNWLNSSSLTNFINEKEQMRFISYLTVTVASYFEIYARNCIDQIENSLIRNDQYYTNKYGIDIKNTIKKLLKNDRSNGYKQINNLYKALGIKSNIEEYLSIVELQNLQSVIAAIIELRNKITHHKPFPDMSILNEDKISPLKEYISSKLLDMKFEQVNNLTLEVPEIFSIIQEEMFDIISNKMIYIGLLRKIPELIVIYAAIFDNFSNVYFDR